MMKNKWFEIGKVVLLVMIVALLVVMVRHPSGLPRDQTPQPVVTCNCVCDGKSCACGCGEEGPGMLYKEEQIFGNEE